MAMVVAYYVFIAADRYVSEVSLSVSSTDGSSAVSATGLESLIGITPNSKEDALHLKEYVHSLDMLKILDEKINLRSIYESQKLDLFFRLFANTDQEKYLEYYRSRVEVYYDEVSGLLNVKVEGFSPDDALLISSTILAESERFINELSHKISREQMKFAEDELIKAKQRYQDAKNELISFQNKYGVFNPEAQAEAKANFITEIEVKISQKETELNTNLSYLNDSAPSIIALKSEIASLKSQLKKEIAKVASTNSDKKLNDLASRFKDLFLQAGFAEDIYKTALTSVEKTRIEASRKVKQLVVIQTPSKPQTAIYPEKIYNIVTIFIILSMAFGVFRLVKAIVEEHRY
ncbi:capsule biosynthesis protein [Campylobacter iguaniorum]|uniref:capsule biosynthesis protein n=1 Tax=Campylobacter iguaniorum TaxID=1244531 RepID=UPI001F3BA1E6|nr:capsule biosynthesis protein [Campylobacter iguaniorum]